MTSFLPLLAPLIIRLGPNAPQWNLRRSIQQSAVVPSPQPLLTALENDQCPLAGMVEMIPNAETLRKIQVEHGVTGSFKDRPLADWLQKHNPGEDEYEKVGLGAGGGCVPDSGHCCVTMTPAHAQRRPLSCVGGKHAFWADWCLQMSRVGPMTGKLTGNPLYPTGKPSLSSPGRLNFGGEGPTFENLPVFLLTVAPVQFSCALRGVP